MSNGTGSTGGSDGADVIDVDALQKRCNDLEARVAQLTQELEQSKKFYGSGSESIARSDMSKASGRDGDSSCEFPLALALAATAGALTSSSEADRSHLLERELHTPASVAGKQSVSNFGATCCINYFFFYQAMATKTTTRTLSSRNSP